MAIPLLGLGTLAKGLGLRKAGANLAKFIADRAVASGVTKDVAAMALPDVLMGSIYGSMTPGDPPVDGLARQLARKLQVSGSALRSVTTSEAPFPSALWYQLSL